MSSKGRDHTERRGAKAHAGHPGHPGHTEPLAAELAGPRAYVGTVPPLVRSASEWSWRLMLIGAFLLIILYLIYMMQRVVVPVVVALLLSVLLAPLHRWLVGTLRFPRGLSVATCVVGVFALVVGMFTVASRQLYSGFAQLGTQIQAGAQEVMEWAATGPLQIDASQMDHWWSQLQGMLTSGQGISTILSGAVGAIATLWTGIMGLIIVVFCLVFFLLEGRRIWTWIVSLLPLHVREKVHQSGRRGIITLSAYVRTQIIVGAVDALGIGLGAAIFVPQLAIPIGVIVFIFSFVPFVGAMTSGAIAALVVLVSHGLVPALIMVGIVLVVQQVESHGLQPFLMGHAVSLHPVAVIIAVSVGSWAAGIVGALFAVPLVAVLNTMILYLFGHDRFPELGTDDHIPLIRKPHAHHAPALATITGQLRRVMVRQGTDVDDEGGVPDLPDSGSTPLQTPHADDEGGVPA